MGAREGGSPRQGERAKRSQRWGRWGEPGRERRRRARWKGDWKGRGSVEENREGKGCWEATENGGGKEGWT